mmetsp:Transcript_22092/g.61471  ORF Transcript_22092/g.61471 Transcript_22092/m.61471 type:complete len:182 (+) Transcript_22092:442-987(+)
MLCRRLLKHADWSRVINSNSCTLQTQFPFVFDASTYANPRTGTDLDSRDTVSSSSSVASTSSSTEVDISTPKLIFRIIAVLDPSSKRVLAFNALAFWARCVDSIPNVRSEDRSCATFPWAPQSAYSLSALCLYLSMAASCSASVSYAVDADEDVISNIANCSLAMASRCSNPLRPAAMMAF